MSEEKKKRAKKTIEEDYTQYSKLFYEKMFNKFTYSSYGKPSNKIPERELKVGDSVIINSISKRGRIIGKATSLIYDVRYLNDIHEETAFIEKSDLIHIEDYYPIGSYVQCIDNPIDSKLDMKGMKGIVINHGVTNLDISWENLLYGHDFGKPHIPLPYGQKSGWTVNYNCISKIKEDNQLKIDHNQLNIPNINLYNDKLNSKLISYKIDDTTRYGFNFNNDKVLLYNNVKILDNKLNYRFELIDKSKICYIYNWPSLRNINKEEDEIISKTSDTQNIIKNSCLAKVINYEKSSEKYGFSNIKKDMLNNYFFIKDIDYNVFDKELNKNISIITLTNNKLGKSLKFLLEDIEIILPDPTLWLKSYNKPKNREINIGSNVKLVNNKLVNLEKNTRLIVDKINDKKRFITVPIGSKLMGLKKDKVNPNCLVTCKTSDGKLVNLKMKQIKII